MNKETYRVEGTDGESVGFVRPCRDRRWAFGRSRTGEPVGVAPDYRLAAVALRDLAEAVR
jgi:hypothetical protein